MKKGLTTLMTVAIVLVSVQSMAMAPIISDLPSVVVGNQASGTQPVKYVYIDAFNLNTVVTDDNTSAPMLKWSYEIVGTPKYTINGDQILNSATDDPVNPAATKPGALIAGPGAVSNTYTGAAGTTYPTEDALFNTVTIRNINLYPYGGTPSTDQSAANQAWNAHSQAVTFWCSDGNLATSATVLFWTDNHYNLSLPIGVQRLSGVGLWVVKKNDAMTYGTGYKPWHMFDPFYDRLTSHTLGGVGICFNVTAAGNSWGSVQSPMPYFTLEQNMVYKLRCTMNSSQATVGKTPFWDFILENWNGNGAESMNLYGMDSFYLDNEGGANTILQTPTGTEMVMYWAPSAFQTPQWNNASTGVFSIDTVPDPDVPRYGTTKDPCVRFRVLDLDSNAALRNNEKSGDICLTKCVVEAAPYSRMVVETPNIVNIGGIHTDGLAYAPDRVRLTGTPPAYVGNMIVSNLTGSTAAWTAPVNSGTTHTPGYVTITPSVAAQTAEIVEITPASDLLYDFPTNNILDNWPIPWQSDKIYQLVVELTAPTSGDAAHQHDVIYLSMEPPTNEIITETWVTGTKGIASPKTGAKQQYMMFYNSGKETKSTVAQLHNLRWRVRFANSQYLAWPNPSDVNNNSGKVILHTVTVNTVKFQ